MTWLPVLWLAFTTATGSSAVPLRPGLVVEHRRIGPAARGALPGRAAPGWLLTNGPGMGGALAHRVGPTWRAEVKLDWRADDPAIELTVTITYTASVRVQRGYCRRRRTRSSNSRINSSSGTDAARECSRAAAATPARAPASIIGSRHEGRAPSRSGCFSRARYTTSRAARARKMAMDSTRQNEL